jgi:hypothetical protein
MFASLPSLQRFFFIKNSIFEYILLSLTKLRNTIRYIYTAIIVKFLYNMMHSCHFDERSNYSQNYLKYLYHTLDARSKKPKANCFYFLVPPQTGSIKPSLQHFFILHFKTSFGDTIFPLFLKLRSHSRQSP